MNERYSFADLHIRVQPKKWKPVRDGSEEVYCEEELAYRAAGTDWTSLKP